ncbi:MAG: leucyl aminopeptidase [Candidatus Hydrogenedentes bacterium]|nr:leucyl aminopeptidase [Candidatus Hydrogenedentota bacterium]
MQIEVMERSRWRTAPDAACLVLFMPEKGRAPDSPLLSRSARKDLHTLAALGVITGKPGEAYFLPTPGGGQRGVLIAGAGKERSVPAETLRRCGGSAWPLLKGNRVAQVVVDPAGYRGLPVDAFVEGLILGSYDFDAYRKKDERAPSRHVLRGITVLVEKKSEIGRVRGRCEYAALSSLSANAARNLANTPANDMTPAALAAFALAIGKEPHCRCEILDEDDLRKLRMNALLGVARGSDAPPQLVVLQYTHPKAKETIALVGKGVTFDTGGISLKPPENMHEMKFDMCGAAAVLCTMLAAAQLRPRLKIICVVPAVENKPGPSAQTPGDIVTACNGTSIEVHNTDAEGRLILADALAYTVKRFRPKAIIDVATLTGACVVALGHYAAGLIGNNDALCDVLERAAGATGERVWRLPLWDDYRELVKGTHADLCNIGPPKEAGTIAGAAFLETFIGKTPWVHLDIAGTAYGVKNIPYLDPKHATGYGVRLLTQWIMDRARS